MASGLKVPFAAAGERTPGVRLSNGDDEKTKSISLRLRNFICRNRASSAVRSVGGACDARYCDESGCGQRGVKSVKLSGFEIGSHPVQPENFPVVCAESLRRYSPGQRRFASNTGGTAVLKNRPCDPEGDSGSRGFLFENKITGRKNHADYR